MLQRCCGLDLLYKALSTKNGCQFRPKDFDRDFAFVLHVLGEVDGGHAAFTEAGKDLVAVS